MHNTNDNVLITYRPDSLQEDNYIADIEAIIENGAYHSDEVSETDDEKTQEEVSRHIRPKNKREPDHHVIRVYDKPWRSRRVSEWLFYDVYLYYFAHGFFIIQLKKILRQADTVGDTIQHVRVQRKRWYDDALFQDESKPPDDAPEWTISSSYNRDSRTQNEGEGGGGSGSGRRDERESGGGSGLINQNEEGGGGGSGGSRRLLETEVQRRDKGKGISLPSINDLLNH